MLEKIIQFLIPTKAKHLPSKESTGEDSRVKANKALAAGDLIEAAKLYQAAIAKNPSSTPALVGMAYVLIEQERFDEALEHLNNAVNLGPASADCAFLIGRCYRAMGQPEKAIPAYREAIEKSPSLLPAYGELCDALLRSGALAEAEVVARTAIQTQPQDPFILLCLSGILFDQCKYVEAQKNLEQALTLRADYSEAICLLGNVHRHLGNIDIALSYLKQAVALQPTNSDFYDALLLTMLYSQTHSHENLYDAHAEFSRIFEDPIVHLQKPHSISLFCRRKLRLGYVSGDLRMHSIAFFIEPVLANHNRENFSVFCYYNYPTMDDTSRRLSKYCDEWRNCFNLDDEALAAQIRADQIDILIDLSGHTGYNRLLVFARKPAPLQLTWLGYQCTTGMKSIDYRITDAALDPPGKTERFHSEALMRLPSSGIFQPAAISPAVNSLPALRKGHITFGCFNNLAKISEKTISVWSQVLKENPTAVFHLGNINTVETAKHFTSLFEENGVNSERISLIPTTDLQNYLKLHLQIDVIFDTYPYNGGTTTFHALWMGVPVIALQGDNAVSRVGSSLMQGIGLPKFATTTEEEYINAARMVAEDLRGLAKIRETLREKIQALLEEGSKEMTFQLERHLTEAWDSKISLNS